MLFKMLRNETYPPIDSVHLERLPPAQYDEWGYICGEWDSLRANKEIQTISGLNRYQTKLF